MILICWGLWLVYALEVLKRLRGWKMLRVEKEPVTASGATVSVVVAMRNEEKGLGQFLAGLAGQTYSAAQLEVILVNDHSADSTLEVAQQFISGRQLPNFTLVNLPNISHALGKKVALATGIAQASGTYILTTDADCFLPEGWVTQMVGYAEQKQAALVSGPVAYKPDGTLLGDLQTVEFAGLIGVGAASIALKSPNMCNGANLLFRKDVFEKVGGYAGNTEVASGDDEFLLHKVAKAFPGGYYFLKNRKAVVQTMPSPTLGALYQQRIRWAGKSRHYTLWKPKLLALTVALVQVAVLLVLLLAGAGFVSWPEAVLLICVKFAVEILFYGAVLGFFGLKRLLWLVTLLQLLYPPFVVVVAIGSVRGKYTWKGRATR